MNQINKINIMNWNARSLNNKKIEFVEFMTEKNIDVACITETFLEPCKNFGISGFSVLRKDRTHEKGGGVALIIKNQLYKSHFQT